MVPKKMLKMSDFDLVQLVMRKILQHHQFGSILSTDAIQRFGDKCSPTLFFKI